MSILPFYRIDLPIESLPETLLHIEYFQGKETHRYGISKSSDEYIALTSLLAAEKNGWRYDLNTYAPKIIFSGNGITINCSGSRIVINYVDKRGVPVQVSKSDIRKGCPRIPS
ncbi:MAG: hypothetical protein V4633_21070 [Pseudomonadota bacterium]